MNKYLTPKDIAEELADRIVKVLRADGFDPGGPDSGQPLSWARVTLELTEEDLTDNLDRFSLIHLDEPAKILAVSISRDLPSGARIHGKGFVPKDHIPLHVMDQIHFGVSISTPNTQAVRGKVVYVASVVWWWGVD